MAKDDHTKDELTEEDKALAGDSLFAEDEEEEYGLGEDDDETDEPRARRTKKLRVAAATPQTAKVLVTKEGLKKLQDELQQLENVKRREVAQRLKEAISYGDLSENSEYEDAKNEQAFVEGRIAELTEMIKNAQIIADTGSGKKASVKIGTKVQIQNLTEKGEPEEYTIVGSTEADPLAAKISNESPLGTALLDQPEGAKVMVHAPAGTFEYKILKIS